MAKLPAEEKIPACFGELTITPTEQCSDPNCDCKNTAEHHKCQDKASDNPQAQMPADKTATVLALPLLSTLLPVKFANGSSFGGLDLMCGSCKTKMDASHIHVDFSMNASNTAATMLCWGVCEVPVQYEYLDGSPSIIRNCNTMTPLEMRPKDDGKMLIKSEQGWSEHKWGAPKPSPVASLLQLFKRLVLK